MEIFVHLNWIWVWAITAFILMPFLGASFYKSNRSLPDHIKRDSEGAVVAWAVGCALAWPLILVLGLLYFMLLGPTFYAIDRVRERMDRDDFERKTEKEVLASIEAEKVAEELKLKEQFKELDTDPMGFDPEPPHKRPQGRLRKSQNAEWREREQALVAEAQRSLLRKKRTLGLDFGSLEVEWERRPKK